MSKGTTVHEDSRPMDENLQKLWWLKNKKGIRCRIPCVLDALTNQSRLSITVPVKNSLLSYGSYTTVSVELSTYR